MRILKFLLGLCLCASMVFTMTGNGTSQVQAQSQTTIVLPDITLQPGVSGVVEAEIDCGVAWCGNVAFNLSFDPTIVHVDSVELGTYFGSQHVEIIDVDNENGSISFRATGIQDDSAGADNVLFRLNVQPLGLGQSPLQMTDLEVKDSSDAVLNAASVDGSVSVTPDLDNLMALLATFDWQIVFVSERDGNPEIYVMDADGSNQTRLTEEDAVDDMPVWSPSGAEIAFVSERDGNPEIYVMNVDGSNVRRLTEDDAVDQTPAWSPDGSKIAFVSDRDGNPEIYVMSADGSNVLRLTENDSLDAMPAWSPDSSQIVFVSERNGERGFFSTLPEGGTPTAMNTGDNAAWSNPAWSPDGQRIAFTAQNGETVELRSFNLPTSPDEPLFDEDVRVGHLSWSRDVNWLVFGSESEDNQDISIVLINKQESEQLTTDEALDYAPDLFDPQFCFVRTAQRDTIRVRVGPGTNRGIFGFFPANQDIRVIGQATADDGSTWWEVDRSLIEGGETAITLWVAQSEVEASRICNRVVATDAPPIIPSSNTPNTPGWGACGSCESCGPYPSSECVTTPEGVCTWDPTRCRNIVTIPDPGDGSSCFVVSLRFRTVQGPAAGPMTTPTQSVNTGSNCQTGGFAPGTSVDISTQTPVASGHFFVGWESNCAITNNSADGTVQVTTNCVATAVYDRLN